MVFRDGAPVSLTRREFDLFQFLCENPRRVFTRSQLLRLVWGYDMVGTERTVDVHVRRLRVKLGRHADRIITLRGYGYRFD
jgi:two-component system OmpR family response regulator